MVHRHHEAHVLAADGLSQFAHHVALGSHAGRVPLGVRAVPERKAVVMLGHRPGELRPGALEEVGPLIGVELRAGELRDEVFVAEF